MAVPLRPTEEAHTAVRRPHTIVDPMFGLRLRMELAERLHMAAVARCLCLLTAVAGLPLRLTAQAEPRLTAEVAVVPCRCPLMAVDERHRLVEAEQPRLMEEAVVTWAAVADTHPLVVAVTAVAVEVGIVAAGITE